MNLSNLIKDLSLKTIVAVNIFLAILVLIPLTIYLSTNKTKTASKASGPTPVLSLPTLPPASPTPTSPFSPSSSPTGPAEITQVSLFYGKIGDSVVISGKNFGSSAEVFFNDIKAREIKFWRPDKIHVIVPQGAKSGKIKVNGVESPYNFIVYNKDTLCQLTIKKNNASLVLGLSNCPAVSKALLVIKNNDLSSPLVPITPISPLSKESLSISQKTIDSINLTQVQIAPANPVLNTDIITIESDQSVTFTSVTLWQNNILIPFFINPLDLNN